MGLFSRHFSGVPCVTLVLLPAVWALAGCSFAPIVLQAPEDGSRIELLRADPGSDTVTAGSDAAADGGGEAIELGVSPAAIPREVLWEYRDAAESRGRYLQFRVTPPAGVSSNSPGRPFIYRVEPDRLSRARTLQFAAPRDPPRTRVVAELLYQAETALAERRIEKAERKSMQLLELEPGLPQSYALLGDSALLRRDFGEATRWYEAALSRDPRNSRALRMLAQSRRILRLRGVEPPGSGTAPAPATAAAAVSSSRFPEALLAWRELARNRRFSAKSATRAAVAGAPVRIGSTSANGSSGVNPDVVRIGAESSDDDATPNRAPSALLDSSDDGAAPGGP